jgi:hypothetical protein
MISPPAHDENYQKVLSTRLDLESGNISDTNLPFILYTNLHLPHYGIGRNEYQLCWTLKEYLRIYSKLEIMARRLDHINMAYFGSGHYPQLKIIRAREHLNVESEYGTGSKPFHKSLKHYSQK